MLPTIARRTTTLSSVRAMQAVRAAAVRPAVLPCPAPANRHLSTSLRARFPAADEPDEPDPEPTEAEEDVRADQEETNMSPQDLQKEGTFIANESGKNETESEQDVDADKSGKK